MSQVTTNEGLRIDRYYSSRQIQALVQSLCAGNPIVKGWWSRFIRDIDKVFRWLRRMGFITHARELQCLAEITLRMAGE